MSKVKTELLSRFYSICGDLNLAVICKYLNAMLNGAALRVSYLQTLYFAGVGPL